MKKGTDMKKFIVIAVAAALGLAACAADPFVQPAPGKTDECNQADGVECK